MTQKQWNEFSSFLKDSLQLTERQKEILSDKKKELSTFIKTTKTKKEKDPSLPARPSSSYIFFSTENRERIRRENPDLTNREIMPKIGEEWRALSDKEKEPYVKKAMLDKERFQKESESSGSSERKKEPKKDTGKKPTSYQIFQSRERPLIKKQNPTLKGAEISKELSSRWKNLTDEQKKSFSQEDADTKADVKADTKKAKSKPVERPSEKPSERPSERPSDKPSEKPKKSNERPSKKTEKHVDTAGFECFFGEKKDDIKDENDDFNDKQIREEVEKMWSGLSKKEREAYEHEASLGKSEDEEELMEDD
jgi:hypothetical protein